jgi:hypothetical protein
MIEACSPLAVAADRRSKVDQALQALPCCSVI